ncbi:hypothetical protein A6A08_16525 [Nocardiopsis sp. TSRI0078]|nr:hypothetical protein A6A08_16525 [Nocardiopsis sp. TSRI0078]
MIAAGGVSALWGLGRTVAKFRDVEQFSWAGYYGVFGGDLQLSGAYYRPRPWPRSSTWGRRSSGGPCRS